MRKRSKKSVTLFDLARLREELERANREIEQPDFWNNLEYAQKVMKEKKTMEATIENYESLEKSLSDIGEMIELTEMERKSLPKWPRASKQTMRILRKSWKT